MIDGSLQNKPENSSSQDTTKVDTPPLLLPIRPPIMQWLSAKVHHTGTPVITNRKPFGKRDHVKRAESKILAITELSVHSHQEPAAADSDKDMQAPDEKFSIAREQRRMQCQIRNAFSCAMEQLARMSPPSWVPRPKHPLSRQSHGMLAL